MPQLLLLGIISRFLELHFEIGEEVIVGWTRGGGAAETQPAGNDVILDELSMVRWCPCQLDRCLLHCSLLYLKYGEFAKELGVNWYFGFLL